MLTLHRSTWSLLGVLNGPLAVSWLPTITVPQLLLHFLPRCKQTNFYSSPHNQQMPLIELETKII